MNLFIDHKMDIAISAKILFNQSNDQSSM